MHTIIKGYQSANKEFEYIHSIDEIPNHYPIHIHDYYEIFILISGDLSYSIDGTTIRYSFQMEKWKK